MNILQMPAYFLPSKGGIEYCVYYMSREFVKDKHNVTLVSSVGENIDGINVIPIKSLNFLKSPFSFSLLFRLFKIKNIDVMHLHYPHPLWLDIGSLFARIKGIPYIVHCHGKEIELKGFNRIFSLIYNKIFLNNILKNSNAIITNTKKVILQSKLLTKYKDKITVIPHGIDLNKFVINENIKKDKKNKIILYVGALREYKGLKYLIKSLLLIKDKIRNIKLIIIGEGDQKKYFKKLVNNLKLNEFVEFKGFVSEKELMDYYSQADLFVLPSPTIEESFGLVALEALAMNLPVIITSGAGVSEIFEKEKIGYIVKPKNSEEIAEKAIEILNKNIKKDYRKILEKYNWEDISKKYLEVYNKIKK